MPRSNHLRAAPPPLRRRRPLAASRRGGLLVDLLVAAGLLVTMVSILTTLTVQSGRVWQQVRHQHLALDELNNQLDRLTQLDATQLDAALADLAPTGPIAEMLPGATLASELRRDGDGNRLVLSLDWERPFDAAPIQLVGWIHRGVDEASNESTAGEAMPADSPAEPEATP